MLQESFASMLICFRCRLHNMLDVKRLISYVTAAHAHGCC